MSGLIVLTVIAIGAVATLRPRRSRRKWSLSSIWRRDEILGPTPPGGDDSVDRDRVRVVADLIALRGRSPHH